MPSKGDCRNKDIHCRFCGNIDNLRYCSKCGLELSVNVASPLHYFINRISFFLQPISAFICTFVLLLLQPVKFFDALETRGSAVDVLLVFGSRRASISFSPWRSPMTPVSYLFAVTLITVFLLTFSGLNGPIDSYVSELFGKNSTIFDPGIEAIDALFIELTLVFLLFFLMTAYRFFLGVESIHSASFFECYAYLSVQFLLVVSAIAVALFSIDTSEVWLILVIVSIVLFSLRYFVFVPMRIFKSRYNTGKLRVFLAYIAMVILMPPIMFGIIWLYVKVFGNLG